MTSLVAWVWQGLLVAGIAGVLVHALPRLNAATRHVIWWIALVLVMVHPWTLSASLIDAAPGSGSGVVDAMPGTSLLLPPPPQWLAVSAFIAWLLVVATRSWQIGRGLRAMARLKRNSHAFPAARERRLPMWRAAQFSAQRSARRSAQFSARGCTRHSVPRAESRSESRAQRRSARHTGRISQRRCELRVSKEHTGACALGFWRPVILLPEALLQALSDEELDQVVMHERAHLLRYDDWLRIIQCTVGVVLGLHPALWFIGKRIDLEREAACDDHVVNHTGAPRSYAACLAHVATVVLTRHQQQPRLVPSATRSTPMLRARIERLLNDRVARTSRLGWMSAIASSLTLVAVVVASGQLPPLVVFAEHEVSAATSAGREFLEASQRLPLAVSMAAGSPASTAATPRGAGPTASHTPRAASAGAASRVRRAELGFEAVPAYIGPDLATVVDIGPPVLPSAPTASGLIAQTPPAPSALTRVSSAGTAGVGDRFAAIGSAARQSGLAINARAQRVGQHFVDAARLVAQKTHPLTPLTSRARHMQRTAVVYRAVLR